MIRAIDIIVAMVGLVLFFPLMLLILGIGFFDTGSPIFTQVRVGKDCAPFRLIKFRTMRRDTASAASHLVSASSITPFGRLLRRTKLDELPQLWNVMTGDMSLVGPRPCLFSQHELIAARNRRAVFSVRPGITGLGQVSGIDMSTPEALAEIDERMIQRAGLRQYFMIIVATLIGRGAGDAATKKL